MNASILKSYNSKIFSSVKNDRKYVDAKFIALNKTIETKLSKTGGEVLGHINMNNNTLTNIKNPQENQDCSTKSYCDTSTNSILKLVGNNVELISDTLSRKIETKLSKTGGEVLGHINMNDNTLKNVKNPVDDQDVANKFYVDSSIQKVNRKIESKTGNTITDEIDMQWNNIINLKFPSNPLDAINRLYLEQMVFSNNSGNIIQTGVVISDFLNENQNIPNIGDIIGQFNLNLNYVRNLISFYNEAKYENGSFNNRIDDLKDNAFFVNLKVSIIIIIENLSLEQFIALKRLLMEKNLVNTPEERTTRKRCRTDINKLSAAINPERRDANIELLVQKNLLLLDLGFFHQIEELMKKLLTLRNS